eukprot:PITA_07876
MAGAKEVSLAFMAVFSCCVVQGAGGATIEFVNECQFPVWPAGTDVNGTLLNRGGSWTAQFGANSTYGRFWGRTGCSFGSNCTTGDCQGVVNCEGKGTAPATMVEYSLNQVSKRDYYDISLVGGFNLPISFIPSNSKCQAIACSSNITANCPSELRVTDACMSACTIFSKSQYCCTGDYEGNNCRPTNYSRFFKTQCPQAYSYPSDDSSSSMFSCPAGTNYTVIFCSAASAPSSGIESH